MPQLTIRGIAPERVIAISEALVRQLADVCGCGTDNFTFDCLQTVSAMDGKRVDTYPFVEVAWFERGMQTRDRFAETITKHLLAAGVPEVEIAFKVYSEEGYYINGMRCDAL
ncbi:DUF1904 family protein [Paenibacillus filicis]|uniref:DUF1904 family protein n=1 Tax=Paenibacillus gyeongsangnamensis TaxID=3388067 RepID=A0ABT4QK36_9BACL|nr:DUF1904 family protein [Paenibacillus filicis]MCZ8517205.1 DUF1904 family protein [Paenibacillus filicis]